MLYPKVSIIIPSLGREEKLNRCINAIAENSGYPLDAYEVIVERDNLENRQGAPKTLKTGVDKSTGELVMFLGNDTIPQKDFLIEAVRRMQEVFPEMDGLVGLNDDFWNSDLVGHWIASKKLLPYLGGEFFYTGYHHAYCDNELIERCKNINKYAWAEKSRIYHDHPNTGGKVDEVYALAYNLEREAEDTLLHIRRSKEFNFEVRRCSRKIQYPRFIDLGLRISNLGTFVSERSKVLNVGVGNGNGDLARQLPFLEFKQLDHLDIEPNYFPLAKSWGWKTRSVNFIIGDIRNYDISDYDLVLFLDIIEHLPKEDGIKIIENAKRAIVFIPIEKEFRPNNTGVKSEDHLSLWTEEDFKSRGFETEVLKNFHGTFDAMWAIKK